MKSNTRAKQSQPSDLVLEKRRELMSAMEEIFKSPMRKEFSKAMGFQIPQEYEINQKLYASVGLAVEPMEGGCWFSDSAVAINHGGVQYSLNIHNKEGDAPEKLQVKLEKEKDDFQLVIANFHDFVREIYDYLQSKNVGKIWALSGGGSQLQIFFGNETGYLAILYLFEKEETRERAAAGKSVMGRRKKCVLDVQWPQHNAIFEGFTHPKVQLRLSEPD